MTQLNLNRAQPDTQLRSSAARHATSEARCDLRIARAFAARQPTLAFFRPSVPRTIVRPISIIRHGTFQAFLLVPENPPFLPSFGFNKVQPVRPVHTE